MSLYRRWQIRSGLAETPVPMPTNPVLLRVLRGLTLARVGSWDLALDEYENALVGLGNHPAAAPILIDMASIEIRQGRMKEAENHLMKSRLIEAYYKTQVGQAG